MSALEWMLDSGRWTLQNSISAAILFVLIQLVMLFVRDRVSSRLRMTLLVLVGIRLFLPHTPESYLSFHNWLPAGLGTAGNPEVTFVGERVVPEIAAREAGSYRSSIFSHPGSFFALLWILIALSIFLTAVLRQVVTGRKIARLRGIDDRALLALVRECGIPHSVRVVTSPQRDAPAVFGSLRVTHLILPEGFAEYYTREEQYGILRHESEHICGNDLLWNWLVFSVQCWHWFNPFIWIAGRSWRREREIFCDQVVLMNHPEDEREFYGSALIKTLELSRPRLLTSPAFVPFSLHHSELKHRLQLIMKNQPCRIIPQLCVILLMTGFAVTTFTSTLADEKDNGAPKPEKARTPDPGNKADSPERGATNQGGNEGGPKPEENKPAVLNPDNTKEGKVFNAYDKNDDSFVDDKEMEAMMEGKQNSRGRREIRKAIDRSDRDDDGKLNMREFIHWYTVGRLENGG